MKAVIFVAALAFAAPAVAFYGERFVNQAAEAIYEVVNIPELISTQLSRLEGPPNPECCRKCNEMATHHIMHAVVEHVEHMCNTTKCPHMQHKCEMARKYPQVAFGFLLAKVTPWKQSYAFCYGAGHCPHPGPPRPHPREEEGKGHCRGNCLHDGQDLSVLMNYDNRPVSVLERMVTNEGNDTCHDCIHHTAGAVMKGTIEKIKAFCQKTECPCIKRACEIARIHPQITLGFLIAKVRPGEWGCGYCFGNGSCHHQNETMVDYDYLVKGANLDL